MYKLKLTKGTLFSVSTEDEVRIPEGVRYRFESVLIEAGYDFGVSFHGKKLNFKFKSPIEESDLKYLMSHNDKYVFNPKIYIWE